MMFVLVGLGGAIGAMLRYSIGLIPVKTDFPILTLLINIAAAVIIGFVVGLVENSNEPHEKLLAFMKTGFCGGFSTLSALSVEAVNLYNNGRQIMAVSYSVLSLVFCIIGVILGKIISKNFKI